MLDYGLAAGSHSVCMLCLFNNLTKWNEMNVWLFVWSVGCFWSKSLYNLSKCVLLFIPKIQLFYKKKNLYKRILQTLSLYPKFQQLLVQSVIRINEKILIKILFTSLLRKLFVAYQFWWKNSNPIPFCCNMYTIGNRHG